MSRQNELSRGKVTRLLGSRGVSTAVFWGSAVGCIATILEYNFPVLGSGTSVLRHGMLIGGIVAGILSAGNWKTDWRAGAYAGAIPAITLAPIAIGVKTAESLPQMQGLGDLVMFVGVGAFTIYPFIILYGVTTGAIGAILGSIVAKTIPGL